jgi:hypothetical protein
MGGAAAEGAVLAGEFVTLLDGERGQQPALGGDVRGGDGLEQVPAGLGQAVTAVSGIGGPADEAALGEAVDADAGRCRSAARWCQRA